MAGLRGYIVKRLLMAPLLLIVITMITYSSAALAVGDPATLIFGGAINPEMMRGQKDITPEQLEQMEADYQRLRDELGLNHPIWIQYLIWLAHLATGDFGTCSTGIIVGIISAIKHNQFTDRFLVFVTLTLYSTPGYWLAFILIQIVAIDMMPLHGGFITPGWRDDASPIGRLIIPGVAMGIASAGFYARITRSSMLEVIRQDYIITARSKGLAEKVVIYKHALKNALIPVVTIIGLDLVGLFGGAVIMETIFSWPGMGRYGYRNLLIRNYPVIMGVVLFSSTLLILMNLVVDIAYAYLDPRIRYG
ncbi:MAG: ABC transporter permease [Candidatus Hodarchaeales archaeon]